MPSKRRIGILTGGGDVPGLNVAIKAVVMRAQNHDIDVVGLRRGWASLRKRVKPGTGARNVVGAGMGRNSEGRDRGRSRPLPARPTSRWKAWWTLQ